MYLAAKVRGENFKVWNAELVAMLQTEIEALKEDGYTCSHAGDFNGHVGVDSQGIPGNNKDINSNERLVEVTMLQYSSKSKSNLGQTMRKCKRKSQSSDQLKPRQRHTERHLKL